ncbi:MAG TPA: CoB--CoM heterodisulfide reductase iron-sulfur subunit A family protein [Anaerolineae bacterium]|nr:CoB--CoM heterodisulfide reductase iron-sulfur subunit A family protein [Anaerolineae bacterium]
MNYRALVIGAGIGGMQAALDIADSGYEVFLVEKDPSIGGHMAQLSETFPTLDCSQCILTPRTVEVGQHPNIRLLTLSEVVAVESGARPESEGTLTPALSQGERGGHFRVRILRHPRYVVEEKCTACGDCAKVCPVVVPNEFDRGLAARRAIYIPHPQAVPAVYRLDPNACLGLFPLACGKCGEACERQAIDYDMAPETVEVDVDAIVVATGYELYQEEAVMAYAYMDHPDVMDGLEFERLLSASGPTGGKLVRPSDGKVPKEVVFIQCAGSRNPEHGLPYCSKICCMYTAKHAILYKHRVHDGQVYVFYIDIRAGGKGYEEFVTRAMEEDDTVYIRGRVSKVFPRDGKVVVWGVDTLTERKVEIAADMVVVAAAIVPSARSRRLAEVLGIGVDEFGFYTASDAEMTPVESGVPGVFLAGAGLGPQDIPETVAQASGAAAKVLVFFEAEKAKRRKDTDRQD